MTGEQTTCFQKENKLSKYKKKEKRGMTQGRAFSLDLIKLYSKAILKE